MQEAPSPERVKQRKYFHDLAAFYHNTGLLLARRRLDKDFTLSLVGPGLADRWMVFQAVSQFRSRNNRPMAASITSIMSIDNRNTAQ